MKVIYNNKEVANNTRNYNELLNKPLINSVELVGNTTLNDLNVYNKTQVDSLIASSRSVKVVTALPTPVIENTMYYVGPDPNNLYHIYLVDSARNIIDLGMSQDNLYTAGNGIEIDSSNEISVKFDNATIMLDSEGLYAREATDGLTGVVKYDNDSIKKNASGQIYVPTTKSGDRFGVYPYISSGGVTDVGKHVDFHITDDSTTGLSSLRAIESTGSGLTKGDLYVQNRDTTSRSGIVLTHSILDGTSVKYNTTSGKVYVPTTANGDRWGVYPHVETNGETSIGTSLRFYRSDTDATVGTTKLESLVADGTQAKAGDLWFTNNANSARGGLVLTTGITYEMPEVIHWRGVIPDEGYFTTWRGNKYKVNKGRPGALYISGIDSSDTIVQHVTDIRYTWQGTINNYTPMNPKAVIAMGTNASSGKGLRLFITDRLSDSTAGDSYTYIQRAPASQITFEMPISITPKDMCQTVHLHRGNSNWAQWQGTVDITGTTQDDKEFFIHIDVANITAANPGYLIPTIGLQIWDNATGTQPTVAGEDAVIELFRRW